jgi:hypothetical protein
MSAVPPLRLERELAAAVRALCARYGVACYHPSPSPWCEPGWPDDTLVGPGGIAFRELKSAGGRLSLAQLRWGWTLRRAGADWDVWRPADLASGRIEHEIRALARTHTENR